MKQVVVHARPSPEQLARIDAARCAATPSRAAVLLMLVDAHLPKTKKKEKHGTATATA
jgi:hypothetical protein